MKKIDKILEEEVKREMRFHQLPGISMRGKYTVEWFPVYTLNNQWKYRISVVNCENGDYREYLFER